MADSLTAKILIDGVGSIIKAIANKVVGSNRSEQRRKDLSKAIIAIQRASTNTRSFIEREGYRPNLELTELWHQALQATLDAGVEEVPQYLFYKAQFWSQPDVWLEKKASLELVPKLRDLNEQCEVLLGSLSS